jgi:alpha-galactosidase
LGNRWNRRSFLKGTGATALGMTVASLTPPALSAENDTPKPAALAPTPPMGWNSWYCFRRNVTQEDVRAAADVMVSSGMRDAGYNYVNIDGSWQGKRDANGVLQPNERFPDIKGLSDYIHARGLKFGMYSGPGPFTCGGDPASYGHEEQDAETFASWGVDFLKYDLCTFRKIMLHDAPNDPAKQFELMKQAYARMHRALLKTGRPIVYSLCQYGIDYVWEWGAEVGGNLWRTSHDIRPDYITMAEVGFSQAGLSKYAGPGRWNDPDMLQVGNGGMSPNGEMTQMSLWAILAAPLLASTDLTKMTEPTRRILMNREVIAVNQDPLGKQGDRVWQKGPVELWAKPLSGGDLAVGLFNRLTWNTPIRFELTDLGWTGPAKARDLWTHQEIGIIRDSHSAWVPSWGVVLLRLSKT